jgi:hypothetical protein
MQRKNGPNAQKYHLFYPFFWGESVISKSIELLITFGVDARVFESFSPFLFHFSICTPTQKYECDDNQDTTDKGRKGGCLAGAKPIGYADNEYGKEGSDRGEDGRCQ